MKNNIISENLRIFNHIVIKVVEINRIVNE